MGRLYTREKERDKETEIGNKKTCARIESHNEIRIRTRALLLLSLYVRIHAPYPPFSLIYMYVEYIQ